MLNAKRIHVNKREYKMNSENEATKIINKLKAVLSVESDQELANALGVSKPTISSWRQRNTVPYAICIRVAKERNLQLNWFFLDEGDMQQQTIAKFPEKELDRQEQAAFDLFLALSPTQRKEISAVILEKKRVLELENRVNQLEQRQYA